MRKYDEPFIGLMKISNLTLTRLLLLLIAIWSFSNAIHPLDEIQIIIYLFLILPISTLLLGLTFLQKDKDNDDFGGGLMKPIVINNEY